MINLIGTTTPPERIHGWLNSHLSIARFYGAIDLQGHRYVIAENEPGQPLVRQDVLQAEAKAAKKANKAKRQSILANQQSLLDPT